METTAYNLTQANYLFYQTYLPFFTNKAVVASSFEEYLSYCGYHKNNHTLTSGGNFGLYYPDILYSIQDSFLFWKPKTDRMGYEFYFNLGDHTHVIIEVFNLPEKNTPRFVSNPMIFTDKAEKVTKFFDSISGFLIKPSENKVGFGV